MGEVLFQNNVEQSLPIEGFSGKSEERIPLLQSFQKAYGYISEENVRQIAHFLKVSESHIYGVASFYSQFHFKKPGDNTIRVCLGTACQVQGDGEITYHENQSVESALALVSELRQRAARKEAANG